MQPAHQYLPSSSIQPLSQQLANQIAAGEVVERPASIIKELLENALDAGATRVDVDLQKGGMQSIRVQDNGYGIRKDELALAVSRHATSKISQLADLENIDSMGFRGEALASISSVAQLTLTSQFHRSEQAWRIHSQEARHDLQPASHPAGTTVVVNELFYNTPARRKFLKSERTEFRHCEDVLKRMALSRFDVAFSLKHNQREVWRLAVASDEQQQQRRIQQLCGAAFVRQGLRLNFESGSLRLHGWLALPEAARPQADLQYFYVNGRIIRDRLITHAIRQAYAERIFPGRYPAYVLYLELDPARVDVNVHPTKHEVRFREARLVHDFLQHTLQQALSEETGNELDVQEHYEASLTAVPAYHKPAVGRAPLTTFAARPVKAAPAIAEKTVASYRPGKPASTQPANQPVTPLGEVVGLVQQQYILLDAPHGSVLVDSRAVRYLQLLDEITAAHQCGGLKSQPVLIPWQLELEVELIDWLETASETVQQMGFDMNRISTTSILVRQIPALMARCHSPQALTALLTSLSVQPLPLDTTIWIELLAKVIADHEEVDWSEAELMALVNEAHRRQSEAPRQKLWVKLSAEQLQQFFN